MECCMEFDSSYDFFVNGEETNNRIFESKTQHAREVFEKSR